MRNVRKCFPKKEEDRLESDEWNRRTVGKRKQRGDDSGYTHAQRSVKKRRKSCLFLAPVIISTHTSYSSHITRATLAEV
jgi:hypothetical protein